MKESIARTLVPIVYALLLKLGADQVLEAEVVATIAAALVTLLIYVGVRLLEAARPRLGWLIGYAKAPTYDG